MPKREVSFEQLFEELEATVERLEAGNLSLDESLALYERGMELARLCGERLDRAEVRIKELSPRASTELPLQDLEQDDNAEGEARAWEDDLPSV